MEATKTEIEIKVETPLQFSTIRPRIVNKFFKIHRCADPECLLSGKREW